MCTTQPARSASPPRASFTEGVARRVAAACQQDDPGARITYVGRDEHERTRVRVRSGGGCSVQAMQRTLLKLMPYATVRTSEDVLDGSTQAEIVVPTKNDEYSMAKQAAAARIPIRVLGALACWLLLAGMGSWAVDVVIAVNAAGASARDI